MEEKWIVLRCKNSETDKLNEEIKKIGGECYCPMFPVMKRISRTRKPILLLSPAYSGYVMISLSTKELLANINTKFRFVLFGGNIVCVSDSIIRSIKELEQVWHQESKEDNIFNKGDLVCVIGGVLKGRVLPVKSVGKDCVELGMDKFTAKISNFLLKKVNKDVDLLS